MIGEGDAGKSQLKGLTEKLWVKKAETIVDLICEDAITLDDLAEFSEELQEQVRFFIER